ELVGELVRIRRIAVREVEGGDADGAALQREHRFDEARLLVMQSRQPPGDLVESELGQEGDTVEALLPVHLDVVAEVLEGLPRKGSVLGLDLLKAENVRLRLAHPLDGAVEASPHAVDVPRRDSHVVQSPMVRTAS